MSRILIPEAQAQRDEFMRLYGPNECACFLSAPCAACTHPGNPLNQDEDESCWVDEDEARYVEGLKR